MPIPHIPDDAPFSGEQRVWLQGFLAGLNSRLLESATAVAGVSGAAEPARTPLDILFGTQTGNAESVATDAAAKARALGFEPKVQALDDVELESFAAMERVIVVVSTYGEGEMPDNAQLFWKALNAATAPRIESMSFAVLALGDTGYDEFCQAGKLIDLRLEQLGAKRIASRTDCDVDYEAPATAWVDGALAALPRPAAAAAGSAAAAPAAEAPAKSVWSRRNPYEAVLSTNRRLSSPSSAKDIRHIEFELGDSGLVYEAGDALGVLPTNDPALVSAILARLGLKAGTPVPGQDRPLGELLSSVFEIRTPSRELISAIDARANDESLTHVLRHGDRDALEAYLWGKDVLDLLHINEGIGFDAASFVSLLRPLQHRAYSISSSPLAHPTQVHLTVAAVRWRSEHRDHGGVCSTFLADRVATGETAGVFVSQNKAFRPPADLHVPMIMIGPGTGVAPFRAFLQQRRAQGASGANWLIFGDQRRAHDFSYEDELTEMTSSGLLNRLDLAFSRDQAEKIYVQTRMREHGKDLFAWLEDGASFYVCGDASRMAKDVDEALHEVISQHGAMSPEAAADYVDDLRKAKRYLRDVY